MENTDLSSNSIGRHILADFHGIKNASYFDDIEIMKKIIYEAATQAKMNIVGETFKKFEPQGLTGCIILAESHLSFHFWPEKSFMSIDVFTCGKEGNPDIAINHMVSVLKPEMSRSKVLHIDRSIYAESNPFGFSLLMDAYGCSPVEKLDSIDTAYDFLDGLTKEIGMTKQSEPCVVRTDAIKFPDKRGLSGSVFLVESGIMLHTISTPEKSFITVDVYSCKEFDKEIVKKYIQKVYNPKQFSKEQFLPRGIEYHSYFEN